MGTRVAKSKVAGEQAGAGGEVTFEQIAVRAHEIHTSGAGGAATDDWLLAERQLHAEAGTEKGVDAEL